MRLTAHADAADFLRVAGAELERDEAANSLILGIALGLANGGEVNEPPPYLASVRDDAGLAAAALMTPPHPLALAGEQADRDAALRPIVADLLGLHPRPTAVVAAEPVAERFAALWTAAAGGKSQLAMRQRVHELTEVRPVPIPAGRLRRAEGEADSERVARWLAAFETEAADGIPHGAVAEAAHRRVAGGEFFFWDDGQSRAMAARARPTRRTISVNAVYTPPEWRARGYATALVAALSQHLLDEGFRRCVLFTDLANPVSNRIYARVGYQPVADFALYGFGASQ